MTDNAQPSERVSAPPFTLATIRMIVIGIIGRVNRIENRQDKIEERMQRIEKFIEEREGDGK